MPEHPITFENLIDWFEDRLDDEMHRKVAVHLGAGCPQCEAELALLRRIVAAGRAPVAAINTAFDPPPGLVVQVKRLYRSPQATAPSPTRSVRVARAFRPVYAFAALLVIALVGLAWFLRASTPLARDAVVSSRVGQVQVQSASSSVWIAMEAAQELSEGVALRTLDGAASVTLFDENLLTLRSGAEIRLLTLRSSFGGASHRIMIEQTQGPVDYAVAALRGKGSAFEVRLPSAEATVSVVGTRFGIAIDVKGTAHIRVSEGFVQVATASDRLVLQAGEEATVGQAVGLAMLMPTSPSCSEPTPPANGPEPTHQRALPTPFAVCEPQVAEKVAQIALPSFTPTVAMPVQPAAVKMTRAPAICPEPSTLAPDSEPTCTLAPTETAAPSATTLPVFAAAPSTEEPPDTCTPWPSPTEPPAAEPSATQAPSATSTPSFQPSATSAPSSTVTPSRTPRPNPSPPSQLDWQGLTVLHGSLREVAENHVMLEATPSAEGAIRVDYDDETYVWGELEEDLEAVVIAKRPESVWQAIVIIVRGEEVGWPLDFFGELGPMDWPSWFWPRMGCPAGGFGAHPSSLATPADIEYPECR